MIAEEKYEFKPETKRKIFILGVVGLLLFGLGVFMAMRSGEGHGGAHEKHASTVIAKDLTASVTPVAQEEHENHEAKVEGHHGSPVWLKRVYSSLWANNVFFTGIGIIGLFFIAIQYAAQAGWSAGIKRIPLAIGSWIPVAGVLTLVLWFVVKGDIFHWTHSDLFKEGPDYDKV